MFEANVIGQQNWGCFGNGRGLRSGEISHKCEGTEKDNVRKEEMMMNTINLS